MTTIKVTVDLTVNVDGSMPTVERLEELLRGAVVRTGIASAGMSLRVRQLDLIGVERVREIGGDK